MNIYFGSSNAEYVSMNSVKYVFFKHKGEPKRKYMPDVGVPLHIEVVKIVCVFNLAEVGAL